MSRPTTTLRIRDEIDVLALVPYVFGFHPEDSLVVVSLDRAGRPFSARIDLPADVEDVDLLVDQLVFPVRRSQAVHAFLIAYTDDRRMADAAVGAVADALEEVQVPTAIGIRAHGGRWWPAARGGSRRAARGVGVPYDLRSHPLTSQSVADGAITFGSRRELAASLEPVGWEALEAVATAHAALPPLPTRREELRSEAAWVVGQVARWQGYAAPQEQFDAATMARVLRGLRSKDVRDVVWFEITRENARSHVNLWREVVRTSPDPLAAAPAGLLAFAAWMAGNGALAWCAVERSLAADPDHRLATLVRDALESATPPSVWTPPDPAILPLHAG